MNKKFKGKAKRLISGFVAAATAITMLPAIPAMAKDLGRYPYTLFAGSSAEGAITTTASNFGVNGNVATNGTISAAGNMNINGTKTENAGLDMIYIFDKIDSKYFSGSDVEEHNEDYVLDELNINISEPTEVLGEAELTGNININTALKAFKDVTLNGEVKNTNDSVIYSKYGDIVIDSTNVNLNGLVYAPFGSVEVKAMNLNLNNVVIIADSIVFDCPNVNANYSTNAADFVGTVSEPLNIPKDEWQYMKDENENGLPDFFENFENWSKLTDSDGDGLPDSIEEYLGSDPNNIDTDGDGLNDYYEVFGTFTDPTKADTDDNGVNDGDEDFDEDGLTNLEEFDNKTNPYIADTDSDGLSDGDEVKTHGTDPLVADTDGDGLDDGDEIVLGTNPLVQDTDGDGIIDSKEKIQQTFTHKVKNDDCAVIEVIVDMECTGNINKTTSVESVMNVDILCTDVVGLVGEPFEIETKSEFDKATLTFKIDKDKIGEIPFDNLLFLWYNEEDDEFIELETTLNEENGTASIITTHFSKYMIVDKKAWFDAWSIQFNYNPSSDETHYEPGGFYPKIRYNTVLAIDCSGSMSWNDSCSQRAAAAEKFIEYMHSDDKTAIVFFTGSAQLIAPMSNDENALKNTLKRIYSSGGTDFSSAINKAISVFDTNDINVSYVNNRIILLSDGEDGGSRSALNDALGKCDKNNKNIKIFTVGFGSANDSLMENIAKSTGGKYYKALSADDLVDIFAEIGYSSDFDMTDTDGDGIPDAVEYAGIRLQNGDILYGCDPDNCDSDCDGLLDGEEIIFDPKKYEKTIYNDDGTIKIIEGYSFRKVSDPTNEDSDNDGIKDYYDAFPLDNSPLKYQNIYSEITMTGSGEHIHKFVAPDDGYYRFELYYDSNKSNDLDISFLSENNTSLCLTDEFADNETYFSDKRIYRYLRKGDETSTIITGSMSNKYHIYVTKATAYLCGGKFTYLAEDNKPVTLDTTVGVSILRGLFSAYGFDVIEYNGNFKDVYTFKTSYSPFTCAHNEIVYIACHGEPGAILDKSFSAVTTLVTDKYSRLFAQNIVTIIATCFSSTDSGDGSIINQCFNSGANTSMGFSYYTYEHTSIPFCCTVFYNILNGSSLQASYNGYDTQNLFLGGPGVVEMNGQEKRSWFRDSGIECHFGTNAEPQYDKLQSILLYANTRIRNELLND